MAKNPDMPDRGSSTEVRTGSDPFDGAVGVAIPAAGSGRRMGGVRKAWLELRGQPLLLHALRPFLEHPDVRAIRVALAPEDAAQPPEWLTDLHPRVEVVAGGATRADSVRCAVDALPDDVAIVLVHDAARPLVDRDVIDRCVQEARAGRGAVAGVPAFDTLKVVGKEGRVEATADRSQIWHAHTPQVFPRAMLLDAYARCTNPEAMTDDASIVESVGGEVVMVEGSRLNLKVTTSEDADIAERLLDLL